ncbi:MAG: PA14 domain-containing protein [Capsulimonas sp.]|uniref:PA14 domain-containing protein n=1 Tax=Capsulimonas sp. TaxID=2494211 RepID=UPI003264C712
MMDRWLTIKFTRLACGAAAALTLGATAAFGAPVAVWTQHNDNSRTGQNTQETVLNVSNVNSKTFGKLFSYNLDDEVYAQPLYVPGLTMPVDNKVHNVVFVATVNNTLYAFDADDPSANGGQPLWSVTVGFESASPMNKSDISSTYSDFDGNIGIVGTPVIDTATGTLYVVSRWADPSSGFYGQELHAIDIHTGAERPDSPVVADAWYTLDSTTTLFDSRLQNQRPALLLQNGVVYIAWGSHGDMSPAHGSIAGYNASDLSQVGVWNSSPRGYLAGIWQSGQGLTTDAAGNIYFMTSNGTFDGTNNFGESVLKLGTDAAGALTNKDYFTPSNWNTLKSSGADLGSAGILGVPGTKLILGGGKEGKLYLLNTDNMGKINSTDNVVQEFQATFPASGQSGPIQGSPVYWKNASGQYIYVWGANDTLRQYQFLNGADANHGSFNSTAIAHGPFRAPFYNAGAPGGFLSVSSNGAAANSGIVWAATPYDDDAHPHAVAGVLSAFDASNVSHVLWTSKDVPSRDDIGRYAKFVAPTVSNGKVYIPSWGNGSGGPCQLCVYGLLPTPTEGTGLTVQYYNDPPDSVYPLVNPFKGTPVLSRVDPTVDFDWGNNSPNPIVNPDHFSAVWTGSVVAPYTDYFTFMTFTDDGVRLWVNGELITDQWVNQGASEIDSNFIELQGGQKYDIRMEYYEDGGSAAAHLGWYSLGLNEPIIPQFRLYPAPATVKAIGFNAVSGPGGVPVAVGVTLSEAAGAGGAAVAMSSSDTGAIPPGTILTVPAGASSAWLTLTPTAVSANTVITATATIGGVSKSANFTVTPPVLKTLTAASLVGGQPLAVKATLLGKAPAGGATIPITSNSAAVTGGSIVIPAGATTGTISLATKIVTADTPVTLTGAYKGVTVTTSVTIQATFQSISFAAPSGYGGVYTSVGVALYAPAPTGGVTVKLASPGSTLIPAGATITIPAGAYSAWYKVTPAPVTTDTVITATATLGSITKTASYTVKPAVLRSVSANSTVLAGTALPVRATLLSPAPAGGVTVPISASSPSISAGSVVIPAGALTALGSLTTKPVGADTLVTLTGTFGGVTQTASVTVQATFQSIAFASASGKGGVQTGVGVVLYTPAPAGGILVKLSSPTAGLIPAGATLTIPAGAYAAWYRVTPPLVSQDTVITVTATLGSTSKSATYNVTAH